MPNAEAAIGREYVPAHYTIIPGNFDWLNDPQKLTDWQEELVDCCQAISLQLSQIQNDLSSEVTQNVERPFRVISSP